MPESVPAPLSRAAVLTIAIVGSREGVAAWQTARAVQRAVAEAAAAGIRADQLLWRSGAAGRGADGAAGRRYPESVDRVGIDAARSLGCQTQEIPAVWERRDPRGNAVLRDGEGRALIDRGAGFARNAAIIAGCDLVIALTRGSPGTADTIARAQAASIPTRVFTPLPRTYRTNGAVPIPAGVIYMGRLPDKTPGEYGNPFPLRREAERETVLARHAVYAVRRLANDPRWMASAITAAGGRCFCHGPDTSVGCHVDTNLRLIHRDRYQEFPSNPPLDQVLETARLYPVLAGTPGLAPLMRPHEAEPVIPSHVLTRALARGGPETGRGAALSASTVVLDIAVSAHYPSLADSAVKIGASLARNAGASARLTGPGAGELAALLPADRVRTVGGTPTVLGRIVLWGGERDSVHDTARHWALEDVGPRLIVFGPDGKHTSVFHEFTAPAPEDAAARARRPDTAGRGRYWSR
jgi:hypothetical protein